MEYNQQYDNSLHYSEVFQQYTQTLVERLTNSYDLHEKHIVDIGGGKGDFLALLCESGGNYGYGFDPSYEGERTKTPAADRIQWFNDYYDERHARVQADLITSRFVFEHIPNPSAFLSMIRGNIQNPERTVLYFEVPNVDLIVRQFSVWDIIYEHCAYFSVESLSRIFAQCGFEVLNIEEPYRKQFLAIEARVAQGNGHKHPSVGNLEKLTNDVAKFSRDIADKMSQWRARLDQWKAEGTRVVAWGAGAKAVGFLNMLKIRDEVTDVVDINPHKRGRYLAGTGQRIVAPADLLENPPEVVILMNPIYREEIGNQLAGMGLNPEFVEA
jgi:hypothetical protein